MNPSSNFTMPLRLSALAAMLCFCTFAGAAESPLADAAEQQDWRTVQSLLTPNALVNVAQPDGMTPLHWAVYHDNAEATKLLLKAGADATASNHYGVTPLSLACTNGSEPIVRLLLSAGADPDITQRGGESPLHTAARVGRPGPVKALIEARASIDARDRAGQTPLMWAAAEGHAEAVDLLIKHGAEARAKLKSGFMPLHFATRQGKADAAKALIAAGVDVNEPINPERNAGGRAPRKGMSSLLLAVENGHFELAVELLKLGADANDQRSGFTPLHALTWVRKPNRGDEADGMPPPNGSGRINSLQFVRELVRYGAQVNTRLERGASGRGQLSLTGATPFLLASKTADLPYMKLLVELGADPLLGNKDGATPFMAAAGIGTLAPDEVAGTEPEAIEAVEYLLTLGADVNTVDKNGETAMHGAAYKSLPKVVQLLHDRGARIDVWNKKDRYGWTPLLIAEGYRPGNFKPSAETIEALHTVMRSAGVTPPPPTPRPVGEIGY